MFEFIQVGEQSYYIESPAKIGVVKTGGNSVCLIDSGNDKDAGKKVLKILDNQGFQLEAIVNTHSNTDHIGGNAFIQSKTGCKIFAGRIEKAFTEYPLLEPSFLYGGFPNKDLRHKFLMAKPSQAFDFSHPDFPKSLEAIPLPGHFFDMVGFRTADNIIFLADCLSSKETLEKYQISFIYDVAEYLNTLDMVDNLEASLFIPSHAAATEDIHPLTALNREKVFEIANKIHEICRVPRDFETLLKILFDTYRLKLDFPQYVLVGSTVRSYLSYLYDQGKAAPDFSDNQLLWRSV